MTATTQELFDDEFTREVRDGYMRLLLRGVPDDEATDAILYEQRYTALMSPAHGALLWLALGLTQARHGRHSALVHHRALRALDDDRWVHAWAGTREAVASLRELLDGVRGELAAPAFPAPRLEIELSHRVEPLDPAHRAWIEGCRDQLRAESPELALDAPPARLVCEAARRLDGARDALRRGDDQRANACIALVGVLWGEQLARTGAWEWVTIVDPADARTCALVRLDRSALISPFHLPAWHLEDPDGAANVLVPLYETLRLAAPAPRERGLLLSLRDFTRRLADPRWPEQREQILNGTVLAPPAGIAPVPADALDSLGDTAHLASDAPLPGPHDGGRRPPTPLAVARRALVLRLVAEHTGDGVLALQRAGLWESTGDDERRLLSTPAAARPALDRLADSYRGESLGCLLWALGLVDALPPYDEAMRVDTLLAIAGRDDGARLLTAPALRERATLEHARTVAELWHWRSRTRQLLEEGQPFPSTPSFPVRSWDGVVRYTAPQALERGLIDRMIEEDFCAFGRPYRDLSPEEWTRARAIAAERHFALNWLCGYAPGNRWSATPTET